MTPPCASCAYLLAHDVPVGGCQTCRRALLLDVAFSPAYRGLPLDRLAAVLIGLAAGAVGVATFHGVASAVAAVVLAAACAYALFFRRRPAEGDGRRRAFRRAHSPGAAAAAAASPIATRRRPRTPTRL